jgi:dCMP deaminase
MNKRPEWTDFWFTLVLMYSTRGTCDRLRAATIIVKDKRIVGAGYNGSAFGQPHCDDESHLMIDNHCERTLHGEENAVLNTDREDLKGATAYMVGTPCIRCTRMMINTGVSEINILGKYPNARGNEYYADLVKRAKVKMTYFDLDPRELINNAIKRLEGPGGALKLWS